MTKLPKDFKYLPTYHSQLIKYARLVSMNYFFLVSKITSLTSSIIPVTFDDSGGEYGHTVCGELADVVCDPEQHAGPTLMVPSSRKGDVIISSYTLFILSAEDRDPVIFDLTAPALFSPDPTCNNGFIKLFSS